MVARKKIDLLEIIQEIVNLNSKMRFAAIMEGLGVAFVDSIMTLIAFLPVLAALSVHVESLPILGAIPYPLVTLSIVWSIFGTLILLFAGI